MENKLIEFVKEFNAGLENSNEYNNYLQYVNNGVVEAIVLPEIVLFSDNDSYENFKTICLGSITKQLYDILLAANKLLFIEVEKFFALRRKLMKEKFPKAKLNYERGETIIDFIATFSGEYNEEQLEEFGDVMQEDFKYLFQGLKIDCIFYD